MASSGRIAVFLCSLVLALRPAVAPDVCAADVGNRLTYLDAFCDPYYVGLGAAKLVTPQWIGEEGVELAIVLSIDDMRDPAVYERYLRPILQRLKRIDGRAPVSITTVQVNPQDPRLQAFLKEGISLETHTFDHPCPCLQKNSLAAAKATFDRCVDLLASVPGSRPVAFRMPCCDSMNSASPRFFTEVFNKTTPGGNFLSVDSSVFLLFTANDPALPQALVQDADRRPRFAKYLPTERKYVNYVEDYPYPYVIGRLCWELPSAIPDDWLGINLHKPCNPITVADMKVAIDATAIKQGIYTLTFHPHNWLRSGQVAELVDHAATKYGRKVKFLNFREVYERLTRNLLGGVPLRAADGQDNGVRVLDLNHDGFMDVVIGNEKVRQTRLWSPQKRQWTVGDFPAEIVSVDAQGNRRDAGARFGVLRSSGCASLLVRNEKTAGLWHFDGARWIADPEGLAGLDLDGPVHTSIAGHDRGVRMVDLDRDGIGELIVANERQRAVLRWSPEQQRWERLPFTIPDGATIVDAQGRDAGCRLVDIDGDGHLDVIFSNHERYLLSLFVSMKEGWSRKILAGKRPGSEAIPMIVRADGSNNGAWFNFGQMWVQNEETGWDVVLAGQKVRIPTESRRYTTLLRGNVQSPRGQLPGNQPAPPPAGKGKRE